MSSWPYARRVAAKEQSLFFGSPVAYLFIAAFAATALFIVFWGESFFARNIADTRPLFEWMPVLLIFLCSALTMRMWSEERRSGTLEHVLTSPVPTSSFVLGKFWACLSLLGCALLTTVPFVLSVSFLGDLDWGPVLAGYLATILLGASYLAIGLFVSSRSNNQIVALLGSVALGGGFYLIGSPSFTELFDQQTADLLKLFGMGSRFESITRGVVDLRDLAYYFGIILTFLSFNALALEAERWTDGRKSSRQQDWKVVVGLLVLNAVGLNLWLGQLRGLRVDVTEGRQYSLSPATKKELDSLTEPLVIRGYFSRKTHPLLAPLVPQLKDLLKEYEATAPDKVKVEIIDPQSSPELEQEAKQEYGVEPTPFQVADRYEAAIVSSYFNIVLKYGDSHQTLGFQDLIEVKGHTLDNVDVQLRNPEYDLTRAIKKVVDSYQKEGKIYSLLPAEVKMELFLSPEPALPEALREFRQVVIEGGKKFEKESEGKLRVVVSDPETDPEAKELLERYSLKPMATSLLDKERFYFYILLSQGDKVVQIPLDDRTEASFERNVQSALKRFGSGFTKTVALAVKGSSSIQQLQEFLGEELNIETEDLSDASVSGSAEVLVVFPGEKLNPKELFAVDQFLMRGGTVIACTSDFQINQSSQELSLRKSETGLKEWLGYHCIKVEDTLVQDTQCAALPVPVTRMVGGVPMQELRLLSYPYFLDIRGDGLNQQHPAVSDLGQLTMSWASPLSLTPSQNSKLEYTELLKSSPSSWLNPSTQVMPQMDEYGRSILQPLGEQKSHLLGVIAQGSFSSFFASDEGKKLAPELEGFNGGALSNSPATAKLIVVSSPSMFSDQMIRLFAGMGAGDALANLTFMANLVDWASQDESLLSIRGRSHFKRTLVPLERNRQMMWETLNYFMALVVLAVIALIARYRMMKKRELYRRIWSS